MEQLVTVEIAKLAREAGFNWNCSEYFNDCEPNKIITVGAMQHNKYPGTISVPTQSKLQTWLRDVHGIQVHVYSSTVKQLPNGHRKWTDYVAYVNLSAKNDARDGEYQTYEAAMEFGLKCALEILIKAMK